MLVSSVVEGAVPFCAAERKNDRVLEDKRPFKDDGGSRIEDESGVRRGHLGHKTFWLKNKAFCVCISVDIRKWFDLQNH